MRKLALILIMIIGVCCFSGCKRIQLDSETEEAYVEYAVNAVINHDKNNMLKLERVVIEKETEPEWIPDKDVADDTDDKEDSSDIIIDNVGDVSGESSYTSFEEALGNKSLSVKVNGIKECTSYPEGAETLAFVVTASAGSRLVVLEMSITNVSDKSITLDNTKNISFKGIFNGVVRTNALTKVLNYALNDNVHTISAGESKNVVLIYELNKERVPDVEKIVISVVRDDSKYNVNVK